MFRYYLLIWHWFRIYFKYFYYWKWNTFIYWKYNGYT